MPKFRVTLSDGRVVTLEAASPPSESDVIAAIGGGQPDTPARTSEGTPAAQPYTVGTLAKAVGKGVAQGMGYAPLKAAYDMGKGIYDDPVGAIPDATAQLGAMGGAALGGPVGSRGWGRWRRRGWAVYRQSHQGKADE